MRKSIREVLLIYDELQHYQNHLGQDMLKGTILVDKVFNDFPVYRKVEVSILVPKKIPTELPRVWEMGNMIDKKYEHLNPDKSLCLAVNGEIRLEFVKGMTLHEWIDKYVSTYFYSYIYFNKFGCYPFGERKHGIEGILEFYSEHFSIIKLENTWHFMKEITESHYKGHRICPCGSEKRVRVCHGSQIREVYSTEEIDIIRNEVLEIKMYIKNERIKRSRNGIY